MKNKFLFTVIAYMGILSMSAQQISVQGTVKDTFDNTLEMANIIALDKKSGSMADYAITDESGRYKLTLKSNHTYLIKISYIGFKSKALDLVVNDEDILKDFQLEEQVDQLDGVEITYDMPVTIKGDTIVYNTDSFTTGQEKKLEDVLEKLPGVEVEDDVVKVEGKEVSKIMVNGKDFFEGDTKLATKNIPAKSVDKVEVLKNYNDVSQMKGLENDSDMVAMNIKLKEGKERFWFGEITAGGGPEEKYIVHPKVFYYSPKNSINVITDVNNIGEAPFTFRDYFKFSGGMKNLMRKGGSNLRLSSSQLGISLMNDDRIASADTRFAAVSINSTLSESFNINAFALYNDSENRYQSNTFNDFLISDIQENISNESNQHSRLGIVKLATKYEPSDNFQWDYDVIYKNSDQRENDTKLSDINGEISTTNNQIPESLNQTSSFYYTINDKHVLSANAGYLWEKDAPIYQAQSDSIFFKTTDLLLMQEDDWYDLSQTKAINTNKLDVNLDYFYILNNISNLNFTLGNTFTHQTLNSDVFQHLTDNSDYYFNPYVFKNAADFKFNDLFLALHYNLKYNKLEITPGLSVHNFSLNDTQFEDENSQSLQKVLPDFLAEYNFKKTRSARFKYAMTQEFSDISKFAQGILLNSYRSLSMGNRSIDASLYHTLNLSYFDFNMFNHTDMHASATYTKSLDPLKTTSVLYNTDYVSSPINMENPDESLSLNTHFGKKFKRIDFRANANWSHNKSYSIVDEEETMSKSFNQNYQLSLNTRFLKGPDFRLGYSYSISNYENSNRDNVFYTHKPFAEMEWYFAKHFTLTTDYSYYNYYSDNSISNSYNFLSGKLYFQKEDSKWEFILSGNNLLSTGNKNNDSASDILVTSTKYFVQPAYYMLSVKYNL